MRRIRRPGGPDGLAARVIPPEWPLGRGTCVRRLCVGRRLRAYGSPAGGDPGDVQVEVEPQAEAELGRVALNMARVVDVQLGAGECLPREAARAQQGFGGFGGDGLVGLRAAML